MQGRSFVSGEDKGVLDVLTWGALRSPGEMSGELRAPWRWGGKVLILPEEVQRMVVTEAQGSTELPGHQCGHTVDRTEPRGREPPRDQNQEDACRGSGQELPLRWDKKAKRGTRGTSQKSVCPPRANVGAEAADRSIHRKSEKHFGSHSNEKVFVRNSWLIHLGFQ